MVAHTDPDKSICDAQQTIRSQMLSEIMEGLRKISNAVNMILAWTPTEDDSTRPMKQFHCTQHEVTQ